MDLIAEKYFIERGTLFNDPYLKNLGKWLKKDYVQAVNALQSNKISSIDHMFQAVPEFNLSKGKQSPSSEKKPLSSVSSELILYPIVEKLGYECLDMITRLRKAPEVKRILNKDWQLDKKTKNGKRR